MGSPSKDANAYRRAAERAIKDFDNIRAGDGQGI
jgi:hypothetical protein